MKKLLLILILSMSAMSGYSQLISVTATQRAGYNIDTTVFYLNPVFIQSITKATNPIIYYVNPEKSSDTLITYKVSSATPFDTLVNQSNRANAFLVKLNLISMVSGTSRDTAIQYAYPINYMVEVKPKTTSAMPKVKSTIAIKQGNKAGYTRLNIGETNSQIKTRVDSLIRVAKNITY